MAFSNPLNWPVGWPRTKYSIAPTFKADMKITLRDLESVLDALDALNPIVTTNHPRRLDGGLRSSREYMPLDPAIALYFTRHGKEVCIPCDKFNTTLGNLRAIGLTLEYMRRMERYGTSQMVDAAFKGFTALPESIKLGPSTSRAWYEVLQVSPDADPEVIKSVYRRLSAMYHPDNQSTGNPNKFAEVQKAYKESQS